MARRAITPQPLGPETLTWRTLGDPRTLLLTARTGLLQVMHPVISEALVERPNFFEDPWERLLRTTGPIVGAVHAGPDAGKTGRKVRDFQKAEPEAYYWAHATFFDSMLVGADLFGHPMTAYEQEQAYEESVQWYAMHGQSMRPVPADLRAFRAYWDEMLNEVLEPTEAVLAALRPEATRRVPVWIGKGLLPPQAREILGLGWSATEERALQALFATLRLSWPIVPSPLKENARARRGRRWIAESEREALLA